MRITKKQLLLLICIICIKQISAQSSVNFDASQVFSTFKYTDSDGTTDKSYSKNIVNAFNLGYSFTSTKGIMLGLNIGLRKAGASKEINAVNYVWNLQYAEVKLGIGYMLNKWRLKPYMLLSPYYSSLLKASQSIGDNSYDIKKDNALTKYDYGVIGSGGINAKLSSFISIYASYNYIYGIKNIETTTSQSLYNRGFSVSLGVSLTITKTSAKWIQQKR